MIQEIEINKAFKQLGISEENIAAMRKDKNFNFILKFISDNYPDKNDPNLFCIALYDLTIGNEMRCHITKKTSAYDKASIYTRSEIGYTFVPLDQLEEHELEEGKQIFFAKKDSLDVEKYSKIDLDEDKSIYIVDESPRIVSTLSRQDMLITFIEKKISSINNNQLNIKFGEESNYKLSKEFLNHYKYSLILDENQIQRKIKNTIRNYKSLFKKHSHILMTNSGTSANDMVLLDALRLGLVVYIHKYWYVENYLNSIPAEFKDKVSTDPKLANYYFLSTNPSNYFDMYGHVRDYNIESEIMKIKPYLSTEKTIVLDITTDPEYRLDNMDCNIVYTMSLSKHQAGWSNYFLGLIVTNSEEQLQRLKLISLKKGYDLDSMQSRFMKFPSLKKSIKKFRKLHALVNLEKDVNTDIGWNCEGYRVFYIFYPPSEFITRVKELSSSISDIKEVNLRIRYFYNHLKLVINDSINNIIVGDSFAFSHNRYVYTYGDYTIDKRKVSLALPRVSFGFNNTKEDTLKLLKKVKIELDNNWLKLIESSFNLDINKVKSFNI